MSEESKRLLEVLGTQDTMRGTDDVLAMVLPLLEQVVALHEQGLVAPLEGIDDLQVAHGRVWFEAARAKPPKLEAGKLTLLQKPTSHAFDITSHTRRVDDGNGVTVTNLRVLEPGAPLTQPAHFTRYVSWEHEVGHHDAQTDIYVLGLVLASLVVDQNLGEADALNRFVEARQNLTQLNPRLHPVVSRTITWMTELDRSRRAQDLRSLLHLLRNYREQTVAASPMPEERGNTRTVIYERLRDRLFDFSRRNRLLYFSPTGQTANLTVGSVPLVLDVASIQPGALLTWHGKAAEELGSGKQVPLGRYLRFEDYPFLTSTLDQLRLDANRSRQELGFSPMRLVACFLHWHNLKEDKATRITSPLLLLPVSLEKKKGVRDAVFITVESTEFEVNPVLRQHLLQLYGVKLPETVPLGDEQALEAFLAEFTREVQAGEPGVTINRIDKPRIDLVLAQAKRRLEAFRKKVALSGRAARSHLGFDYSYARSKFHPLGVQLFANFVFPSEAPDRVLHDDPAPRIFRHSPEVVEKSLYSLNDGGASAGPYAWSFDFCNVTLANFNSRKMSLVRDYAALLESGATRPTLDALFSEDARPVTAPPAPLPLQERFEVMPSDPTQSSAVARARTAESFIIQGPPGTGKSQTITNLLADAVARGKRVLFVCEKRAAIDVVFHRLQMQGLTPLTCLIHDSQADKKAFIKDLKETYERWISQQVTESQQQERARHTASLGGIFERGARFRAVMTSVPRTADQPIQELLERVLSLHAVPASESPLVLPSHRELMASLTAARAVERALRAVGAEPILGRHPLRRLSEAALFSADPAATVQTETRTLLLELETAMRSPLVRVGGEPAVAQFMARRALVESLRPLILEKALRLLEAAGSARASFNAAMNGLRELAERTARAVAASPGWKQLLPPEDVPTALARARQFDASFFSRLFAWVSPSWWQLRRVLNASFDFAARAIRPSWQEVLEKLSARYAAEGAERAARDAMKKEFALDSPEAVDAVLRALPAPRPELAAFQQWLPSAPESDAATLLDTVEATREFEARLARVLTGVDALPLPVLRGELETLQSRMGDLPALLEPLRGLSVASHRSVATALRDAPLSVDQLELHVSRAAVDLGCKERALDLLSGDDWDSLREATGDSGASLRRANAAAIVERARNAFLENVARAAAPAATLSAQEKQWKKQYAAGRKELEHEFGKSMRYRSIRDLAAGFTGAVVRDLKPLWLMSPLSVADTLPLDSGFDLVVFDEASQIPLEDAVPAAYRAAQLIVVGDEMQLPPSDFFSAGRDDEREEEEGGLALDAQSLLSHSARVLPATMLGWHYRSRDEALIAFSNRVFYEGSLLTVPSVSRLEARPPIVVKQPTDGVGGAEALLQRPVSFHRLESSPYEQRRNTGEARYIAELLRELLKTRKGQTLGVVAFSEAQQREIELAITELGERDPAFAAAWEAEVDREEEGQHVGAFVKNLENVQGDERDIIIVSVCYGPDARGKMLMNFGPINKAGGEKRLNVIFSRAKHHIAIVSSIRWPAITNEYNDGANCLRNYLRYAEALSVGSAHEAALALQAWAGHAKQSEVRQGGPLEEQLATALRARGLEIDTSVGTSRFRCNLGVRRPGEARYRLGILLDDSSQQERTLEEVLQAQTFVLGAFGWRTLTVLHRDWYENPGLVLKRIETALSHAP